jgi:hypothetical protein
LAYLGVELSELLVCQRSLLGRDAPRRQEVAQVLVEKMERVDVAEVLELILHSMANDVLLQLLDEPTSYREETN